MNEFRVRAIVNGEEVAVEYVSAASALRSVVDRFERSFPVGLVTVSEKRDANTPTGWLTLEIAM